MGVSMLAGALKLFATALVYVTSGTIMYAFAKFIWYGLHHLPPQ